MFPLGVLLYNNNNHLPLFHIRQGVNKKGYKCVLNIFLSDFLDSNVSIFKGTGHFFETLSVGSVPGADHS